MLFLCTSLIIGGFRYRKKGGIVDLPLPVPWHRLWMRKEISHPSSLDSSCEKRFTLYFCTPYSMTCIRLWFLNFQKWQTYVNNLSIPYRMPLVGSKSVHKRAGNTWSKKYLKFMVFAPLIPPPLLRIFEISFFRNVDHVEVKRMPFEF